MTTPDSVAADLAADYFDRIRFFAGRKLRDVAAGEDAAQETLRRVLEALREGRVEEPDRLPAFVFQTARHVCLQYLRKRSRESRALARFGSGTRTFDDARGLDGLVAAERVRAVRRALARLREVDREILRVSFGESRTADQIATVTGLTPEAVRVRKHRALRRLADLLSSFTAGNEAGPSGTST